MKKLTKVLASALLLALIPFALSAQSTRFNLSYSYYNSFNSEINVINGVDTISMSKSGKGHLNRLYANLFFEDNFVPGVFFGISAEVQQKNIGKITNDWVSGDYDHRILYGYDYALGAVVKWDEIPINVETEANLGVSLLYQSHEINWLSRQNNNQAVLLDYKRFGVGVNFGMIMSRPSYESRWLPKGDFAFKFAYFPEKVMEGNHLAYAGEINLNLVKILQGDRFYLSPTVGFSVDEVQQVSLGFSPFISGGLALSLSEYRADFIKVYYQKRVYQEIVPQYTLDGIFFSVNIGCLFNR